MEKNVKKKQKKSEKETTTKLKLKSTQQNCGKCKKRRTRKLSLEHITKSITNFIFI